MSGQQIGYIRVSSFDQNPERQLEGVVVDRVFTDKASGKDTKRPELDRLRTFVREGDTVVVHRMDRLARNLDDLRRLVQQLTNRGVSVTFVKENLTFTQELRASSGMLARMGRKGNCWDNAVVESFFSTLKVELPQAVFARRAAARRAVFDYIERFYNRKRRPSSLGYATPLSFAGASSATALQGMPGVNPSHRTA